MGDYGMTYGELRAILEAKGFEFRSPTTGAIQVGPYHIESDEADRYVAFVRNHRLQRAETLVDVARQFGREVANYGGQRIAWTVEVKRNPQFLADVDIFPQGERLGVGVYGPYTSHVQAVDLVDRVRLDGAFDSQRQPEFVCDVKPVISA